VVRQYDVFSIKKKTPGSKVEFVIVLQSDALSELATVVVAPIVKAGPGPKLKKVMIDLRIGNQDYIILMPELGSFPCRQLGVQETNVAELHSQVMAAVDFLFAGI
jgi:mRNA-degrading endonuclease toxin of MazEF toxin-antitoxin module